MSQYSVPLPKGRVCLYGFDRILQYYFMTIMTRKRNAFHIVGDMGDIPGRGPDLAEELKRRKIEVPAEHLSAMELDLPI